MLKAPFLKNLPVLKDLVKPDQFPFNRLEFLSEDFSLEFTSPITFFVGENGSGKSTILEASAGHCGFHESGGSRDHVNYSSSDILNLC